MLSILIFFYFVIYFTKFFSNNTFYSKQSIKKLQKKLIAIKHKVLLLFYKYANKSLEHCCFSLKYLKINTFKKQNIND